MLSEFLLFLSTVVGITWSFVFVFTNLIGISLYNVSYRKLLLFKKQIKYASIWNENNIPEGWIIGLWYIGYIDFESNFKLLCTKKFYKTNIENIEDQNNQNNQNEQYNNQIILYERYGALFQHTRYIYRRINVSPYQPYPFQNKIIKNIINAYKPKSNVAVLLYGDAGKGKSMIPYFLAKHILVNKLYEKINLCDTFNPIIAGESFVALYNNATPTTTEPLILVIEEIDIIINNIHNNLVKINQTVRTLITDKNEWNLFLDRFDRGIYKNVFLILTTNKHLDYFNQLDESYMRKGRIDLHIKI